MTRSRRQKALQPGGFHATRASVISILCLSAFGVLAVRAIQLHLFPGSENSLRNIASVQYSRDLELSPYRGTIYDRRGEPLAISIRRPSLAINPRVFDPSKQEISLLARRLKMSTRELQKLADRKNYFAWIKRKVPQSTAESVLGLNLRGLYAIREPGRFYPAAHAAAQLLGFVGTDNKGLMGLEREVDKDLRGRGHKIQPSLDAHGQTIYRDKVGAAPEKNGNSIYLTIDRVIQEIAEDELAAGVAAAKATKGYAVVADPHTGRVLAVANYPHFNPNHTKGLRVKQTRNHALLDTFEPGSVTKPFLIAQALEDKKIRESSRFDCGNGKLRIGRRTIKDTHKAEVLDIANIIIQSSNICAYRVAARIGKEDTYKALQNFGLATGDARVGFPGEERGYIRSYENWRDIRFANIAFGQGFTTTSMELVQGMSAIANGGRRLQPTILDRVVTSEGTVVASATAKFGEQIISASTARTVRNMLEQVVTDKEGTGSNAATELFSTAGKTGTAEKVVPGERGYSKDKYLTSFLGFSPVRDPHIVVYVVIDEPTVEPFYGGVWAAPVFSKIVSRTLKYLNVDPDKPVTISKP